MDDKIRDSKTSHEFLSVAYEQAKLANPHLSLANICKQVGIRSKGYLSEVFNNKKILNIKYVAGIARSLGLTPILEEMLECLVALDHLRIKKLDHTIESRALQEKHDKIKQHIRIRKSSKDYEGQNTKVLFYIHLLSIFALFKGRPKVEDLKRFLGHENRLEVQSAVEELLNLGIIEKDSDTLRLVDDQLIFTNKKLQFSYKEFLKDSLRKAQHGVDKWHNAPEVSHFTASVVSVEKQRLKELIKVIDRDVLNMQLGMESKEADQLMQFNVQIFPLEAKDFSNDL